MNKEVRYIKMLSMFMKSPSPKIFPLRKQCTGDQRHRGAKTALTDNLEYGHTQKKPKDG